MLCSRILESHLAAKSYRRMVKTCAWLSRSELQSLLILTPTNYQKPLPWLLNNSRFVITYTLAWSKSLSSLITLMPSEIDYPNLLWWCPTRILLRLWLVTDPLTTKSSLYHPIRICLPNLRLMSPATRVLSLHKHPWWSTCKTNDTIRGPMVLSLKRS